MGHSGVATKAAFRFETGDYGTPIQVLAGAQIHYTSEAIRSTQQQIKDNYLNLANRGYSITDQVLESVTGTITLDGHYNDIDLLAAALGFSHLDNSPVNLQGDAWQHKFYFDDDKADRAQDTRDAALPNPAKPMKRRGTLAIDKDANVWQYPSVMVNTWSINADSVGGISFSYGVISPHIGLNELPNGSSAGWSFLNDPNIDKILFQDADVYMTDFNDPSPRDSSNLVCLDSFSITFDSHLTIQNDRSTNTTISQPWGSLGTVTGNLSFPFLTTAQESTQLGNLFDASKVRIIFEFISDTTIPGNFDWVFSLVIDIKQAFLTTGGADVSGAGRIPTQLSFIADRTEVSAVTDVPNDVEVVVANQMTVNPLEY